ncbi:mCG1039243, isoform CRA_c, partial [Mus musculus]
GRFVPATAHLARELHGASETLGLVGQRHGSRRRPVRPSAQGSGPCGRHPVRCLLQGAVPHPARLLRAGLAAAHELPVLLHRGLRDPQHPPAGTHLEPCLRCPATRDRKMAASQVAPRHLQEAREERAISRELACAQAVGSQPLLSGIWRWES